MGARYSSLSWLVLATLTAQLVAQPARPLPSRRDRMQLITGAAAGAMQVASGPVSDPFLVPGVDRTPGRGINTLRTVFRDPKTGQVVFLGTYDPTYATGAIDYTTLLADALRSPYPAFSLDPSPATRANREALLRKVDSDLSNVQRNLAYGRAWAIRIGNMLFTDPALELDRRRFLKRGAEAMGADPSQVKTFWDLATGQTKTLSPEWFAMATKLFAKMGAPEVGQALYAMQNNDVLSGLDMLGLTPLLNDMRSRIQNGTITQPQASDILQAAFWEQILLRLKMPDTGWRSMATRAKAGSMPFSSFLPTAENLLSQAITDRVMTPWLNGLVLSQAFLERFYQVPPVEVTPAFLSGLTPDSELARTFFAADWNLKMLAISPELADKVPGHLTYMNFAFSRGYTTSGDSKGSIRGWLTPFGVDLRHDPQGNVVTFGPSRIAVRSELTTFEGGNRSASAVERQAVDAYAQHVTQSYDAYAKALPDLHRLREAAKVLALVRWAKGRNLSLVPAGPVAPPKALPARFNQGFWTATMLVDATRFFFVLSSHGGVDFDAKVGDAWVQPKAEAGLADTALKQLVGSAALGQQAADAALRGDLEGARALAQRSEQAMIGDLRDGLPGMPQVPTVPEPAALAAFQGEALLQSQEAIAKLQKPTAPGTASQPASSEADRQAAEQKLRQLKDLMAQAQSNPASAGQLLLQIKTGPPVAKPPVVSPPAPQLATKPVVPPEARAQLRAEITQMRSELCRVQAQLRRFNATIQMDQSQRAEWERVTNEAYQRALDEVKDAFMDELKDLSMDLPKDYLEDKLAKAGSKEEQERIKRSLRLIQRLKESYELQDFSVWASYEDYSREEILEGIKMIAELTGADEWIKNKLVKKWGLGRVLAFGEAAQDVVASAYDVTSEVLAWRRLNQLNRNSESFLKAVEGTAARMRSLVEGIHAREVKLGLPPGSTKEVCP